MMKITYHNRKKQEKKTEICFVGL